MEAANLAASPVRAAGRPPGPSLPRAVQSFLYFNRRLDFVQRCRRRYGDVFRLSVFDYPELVYAADLPTVKRLFSDDPSLFHTADHGLETVAGPGSIFLLDEDEHVRERKLLMPPFHGEALASYAEVIRDVTRRDMARWPSGRPLGLRPRFQAITLEVIVRTIFGITDDRRVARLLALAPGIFDAGLAYYLPALRKDLGPLTAWGRRARVLREIDEILYEEIARRRAGEDGHRDVLAMLLATTDEDGRPLPDRKLRDQLMTLYFAGHETTATGLAWTFELLMRRPDALARLREELAAGEERYLGAVIKEALRMRPPIPDIGRRLSRDATVAGYDLPAGTFVMGALGLVQLDPANYERPEEFRPERFLEGEPPRFTWVPFSLGHRRCLGAAFATMEMEIVVREVLTALDLRPARSEPEHGVIRGIALEPHRGAEVVCAPKRATAAP